MPADLIGELSGATGDSVDGVPDEFFERLLVAALGRLAVSGGFDDFGV